MMVAFPSEWNRKIQFKSNQLCSRVTLDGVNIQEVVVRVYAVENLRMFEHFHVRNHVVASDTKNSNEMHRQFLDHQIPRCRMSAVKLFGIFQSQENT